MAKELPEKQPHKKKLEQEEAPNPVKENVVRILTFPWRLLCWLGRSIRLFWQGRWWQKVILIIVGFIIFALTLGYGIACWYRASTKDQPLELGVTYVADYAAAFGLNPEETYTAILDELQVKNLRLVSYWNKIEATEGTYNFAELDKQFAQAQSAGADISLALGVRQPRWPECHIPDWAKDKDMAALEPQLQAYITAVVNRYKDKSNLKSWQLENEALLGAFGECPAADRDRLEREFTTVKTLDRSRPIIMTRSNNMPFLALGKPRADIVGMSVYRRVWNQNLYKGYFNYPLPSWYYAALAGSQKLVTDRDSILHEMQMEPWPPNGQFIADVSKQEQDKSMNAAMFADRIDFAKNTGMRQIDLWGAEWWYYRKVVLKDNSLWQAARETFTQQ
ncbi:MAG: endo-1,4-beta-xylanase [Candidatus Saccharimonadales bacterium]